MSGKKECYHPERPWQETALCDLCRYRRALEEIMDMGLITFDPTTKAGKWSEKVINKVAAALYPEGKDTE